MNKIKSFSSFINEKLGIVSGLEEIAIQVIEKLRENSFFQLETKIRDYDITVEFYLLPSEDSSFTIKDFDNKIFKIRINKLDKYTLIHELKHLDRSLVLNVKNNVRYTHSSLMNHITEFVTKSFGHLFIDKQAAELLGMVIYYSNPDEFEAYYNEIYYQIRDKINKSMTREEKIKIIDDTLNCEPIYIFYRHIFKYKFQIRNYFKNNSNLNQFLNEYKRFLDSFINKKFGDKTIWLIFSIFKKWYKSKLKDEQIDKYHREFDDIVNESVRRNYKKFNRLYSALVL